MTRKPIGAFISGCSGIVLTEGEKAFFARSNPWGLILFKRNCETPEQVRKLTGDFRAAVGRKDAPVLIDQEGGRVQRMGPPVPEWRKYPAAEDYGKFYESSPLHALRATRLVGRLMAEDLESVGITVNCTPVLDLPRPDTTAAISSRAFSTRPDSALVLARAYVDGLISGGVLPVMKHIPGHGRAVVDSHYDLPVIKASRAELEAHDFRPFAGMAACPMAMTAHVILEAIDSEKPATQSKWVIRDVIRKQLGFSGLLMTDDLSMKALSGSLTEKTRSSLLAGVDLVLHCNGILPEMEEVAAAAGILKGKPLARAKAALKSRRKPLPYDKKMALRDLESVAGAGLKNAA
ncbi:beta-N-acetylhexosaminidase [Aestuariivirga sp.]|uniref:beta-N-acetylhexosaminidase n=1 Tax=Aestuariivirga sp. TaxID=2650926 RepID=UPI0039E61265